MAVEASNPYIQREEKPPGCIDACSFCCGEYRSMFPPVVREGVCLILMDLFSGEKRISGDVVVDTILVENIKKYPNSNRMIFGVSSNKKPPPVNVKKLVLVLLASGILSHSATIKTVDEDSEDTKTDKKEITIKALLAYSKNTIGSRPSYALDDDEYWKHIRQRPGL